MSTNTININILLTFLAFASSFLIVFISIPFLLKTIRNAFAYEKEGGNALIFNKVPSLGGIVVIFSTILSLAFWVPFDFPQNYKYAFGGFLMLFFLGIRDDFKPVSPFIKFIFQILIAGIIVVLADIRITNGNSLFGLQELSNAHSLGLSIFIIVFIINAFNFIDGINALLGSLTILINVTLGTWFIITGLASFGILAFALSGACFAFLYYNITPSKIFMGDAGALAIGTLVAILSISFLEHNLIISDSLLYFQSAPAVLLSILIIPIFDAIRVLVIRIIQLRSPFQKDRMHIHHLMLEKGFTHMQSTGILIIVNLIFILFTITFQQLGNLNLFLILLLFSILLTFVLTRKKMQISSKIHIHKSI
ncbi:MAG: undecaprenyl/decaprenyl-phosphate alpha-N-acetylglucosaminyl 1-phosphate transferase [Saprospiraceae bacterium]|nr:undecaprenyl/decaprenyl-phosphate alpha-N-acetylglucosaminyl 1-phosphate transferase [Bacteroidia bacterium]NNL90796.1 undecaprenyl/decaprenyl-phosphate alpha-N-acetylglucosaminyl 1-phosphate transferase [Saprospiraceae bacterium]